MFLFSDLRVLAKKLASRLATQRNSLRKFNLRPLSWSVWPRLYKRGKAYATMSKVIMGNGGFYGCLSEPQGVSAWWNETAQTRIHLFLFLVAESH